ncbi:MAG: hypothetical protein ACKOXD_10715, partial [Acinetobacter sp.]
ADPHGQSVLTDRLANTLKSLSFWWVSLRAPSAAEREGDTFGCADPLAISLSTLFRFATII